MIYLNTPLTGSLQSPMQIQQGRGSSFDLPMSNVTRKQLGIQPEVLRNSDKYKVLPTHYLYVGQSVMYQDSVTRFWHPTVIKSLCQEKTSYMITTIDGVVYRKMQAHLKPYTPENRKSQAVQCVSQPMAQSDHMQPVKQLMAQSGHKTSLQVNNWSQGHIKRPKRDTKPPVKLAL